MKYLNSVVFANFTSRQHYELVPVFGLFLSDLMKVMLSMVMVYIIVISN